MNSFQVLAFNMKREEKPRTEAQAPLHSRKAIQARSSSYQATAETRPDQPTLKSEEPTNATPSHKITKAEIQPTKIVKKR